MAGCCMLSSVVIWVAGLQGDVKVCVLHSKLQRPENSPLGFSIFFPLSFPLMAYAAECPNVSNGWHLEPLVRTCYLLVTRVFLCIFSETHCPYPISSPVFRPILSSLAWQCSSSVLKWISSAHSLPPSLPSLASSPARTLARSLGIGGTTVPLPSFLPRCRCRQATPTDRVHDFCRIMRLARSSHSGLQLSRVD